MIDAPGIYDLDDVTYHGDPCPEPSLSAGTARILLSATPRHAADKHPRLRLPDLPDEEEEPEAKFDLGKAVHAIVTGKGGKIVEIESRTAKGEQSDSKNTTTWKKGAAVARAAGDTPFLPSEALRVRLMASIIDGHLRQTLGKNPFADREHNELAMLWKDGPIWCRAKPDAIDYDSRVVWDLKTTAMLADPDAWAASQLRSTGIDLRAAHYLHGTKHLIGPGWRYVFVVVEATRPFAISIVELPGSLLEVGEDMRRRAAAIWARCIASGEWPGWTPGITLVEAPAYHEIRWVERRERHPTASALAAAHAAQAPV